MRDFACPIADVFVFALSDFVVDDIELSTEPNLDAGLFFDLPYGSLLQKLALILLTLREAPVVILLAVNKQDLDVLTRLTPANNSRCVNRH